MCRNCAIGSPKVSSARPRVLQLLELIENPNALPADAALRIAGELLAWVGEPQLRFQCEAMITHTDQMDTLA
jgi:hypothetical protein